MMGISSLSKINHGPLKGSFSKKGFLFVFLVCLICSFLFHFFILKKCTSFEIYSFNPSSFDKILPRHMCLKRVEIDKTVLEQEVKKIDFLVPVEIHLSENKISSDSTAFNENVKPHELKIEELSEDKPNKFLKNHLSSNEMGSPSEISLEVDQNLGKNNSEAQNLLKNLNTQQTSAPENYSQLEQLLEEKTPLTSKTAPILLPTDILFEYNLDQLKEDAEKSLEKLAILIQRNPKSEFIIEGFTDSFGSDQYNLDLSRRRAESIKKWLLDHHFLDGSKIQTKGLGKTHFIAPSTGNIEQQRLNRRVEIVIH